MLNRRTFLGTAGAAMVAAAAGQSAADVEQEPTKRRFRKAVKFHMINTPDLSMVEKFQLLRELGYDGTEVRTRDQLDRDELKAAITHTGLPVHGVINSNSPEIRPAVDLAKFLGGTSVLVVAGRVKEDMPYDANYAEWQKRLRDAAPYAEQQGIKLLIENVANNFLLSPLEMRRFVDEIDSPAVGVYFDIGNVVRIGWPEQWIRILGERIKKLDIKDYSRRLQYEEGVRAGSRVKIGEGDVDWPVVRAALADINYTGWATAEVPGGDRERLAEIAERMNRVLGL